jgi:hypothetical protein
MHTGNRVILLRYELLLDFVALSTDTSSEVIRVLLPLTISLKPDLEAVSVRVKGIFPVSSVVV